MIFIWGSWTFSKKETAIAIQCPYCGERTIGDILIRYKSHHLYFITYSTKEIAKHIRCRFCSSINKIPENVYPKDIWYKNIFADDNTINETNPTLNSYAPFQIQVDLPEGVNRHTWALLNSIRVLATVSTSWSVAKFIYLFSSICLFAFIVFIAISYVNMSVTTIQKAIIIPLFIIMLVFSIIGLYKVWRYSLNRKIWKELGDNIQSFLAHTKQDAQSLIEQNSLLGKKFRVSTRFLYWLQKKHNANE